MGHLPVTLSQGECSCRMRSLFCPADRLGISPCEVGWTLLSSLAGKSSCCSFHFGEKGCLSSRDAHWLRHFANRHEFKSTSRTAEKESPTQGGARAFSGCCRGLGIRQQRRELRAESRTSASAWRAGQRWLHEALVYRCQFVCHPFLPFTTRRKFCTLSFWLFKRHLL